MTQKFFAKGFRYLRAMWSPYTETQDEFNFVTTRTGVTGENRPTPAVVQSYTTAIEGKSGVLLTHISMMIAITGLMLTLGEKRWLYEFVLAFELMSYLLLALLCIRCQYQFDSEDFNALKERPEVGSDKSTLYQRVLIGELFFREKVFRFTLRALYVLTILIICTLFVGLFGDNIAAQFQEHVQGPST